MRDAPHGVHGWSDRTPNPSHRVSNAPYRVREDDIPKDAGFPCSKASQGPKATSRPASLPPDLHQPIDIRRAVIEVDAHPDALAAEGHLHALLLQALHLRFVTL